MSVIAGEYNRSEDWVFVAVLLAFVYLVIYPAYIIFLRNQHARRIKRQLVTSAYKLPISLSPTELAYVFSSRVKKNQLFSTLLDMANRSLIVFKEKNGIIKVEVGPKVESKLSMHEQILFDYIEGSQDAVPVDQVLQGHTIKMYKKDSISGSRNYVYWWFLRQQLRDRNVIQKQMVSSYTRMLFSFGVVLSLLITTVVVFSWQIIDMALDGEVDFSHATEHLLTSLLAWIVYLIPIIIVSFLCLRFRGKMLGRHWLFTASNKRYLNQIIAYREFVRLTHKNSLRFESKDLEKASRLHTKPYALALEIIDS